MPGERQAWNAPFYAPFKKLGSWEMQTQRFNMMVVWAMIILLFFMIANRIPEKIGYYKKD
jgi:hypothetical protein